MTAEILNRFYRPKAELAGKSRNYTRTEPACQAGRGVTLLKRKEQPPLG